MSRKYSVLVLAVAAVSIGLFAQTETPPQEKSLADIARENKAKQQKAPKVVVDDDSGFKRRSAFPEITATGLENSEALLAAVTQYRKTHTLKESEETIHSWWEDYDALVARAYEENNRIDHPLDVPIRTQAEYRQAYEQRARDLERKKENQTLIQRVYSAFYKVRGSLVKDGIQWDWFKLRCGNEYCPADVQR